MSAVSVVRTIEQPRIDAYAAASGDFNPIHTDATYAASTLFGGTIAHGMLVLALIGEVMHQTHPDAWLRSGRLKVRFKAPTRPGDTLTASAEQTKAGGGSIEYAVRCVNQRGEVLIEGRAGVQEPS